LNLAELGAFAEGLVDVSDTIPIAQAAHDVFSLAGALRSTGYLYLLRGDLPNAIPLLAQSLDVCQTGEVYLFLPRVMAYLGYAYALAGRLPEALPLLEQAQAIQEQARAALTTAMEMYRTMKMTFWLPQVEAALAQVA
jgi:tetratricopeptide (TPR) repeat protein